MEKILEELNEFLNGLTDEEKKERLLYLKKLADGTLYGPETGYLNIDKPWLKNYSEKFLKEDLPEKTIYDYLLERTKEYSYLPALSYYGKKITFSDLQARIHETARILTYLGVQEDDRVLSLMYNIPEATYFFYSNAMIGGVSNYMDPLQSSLDLNISAQRLLAAIKREKIKHIICSDIVYLIMIKPIEDELLKMGIDKIVTVSADHSMDRKAKLNYVKENIKINGLKETLKKLSDQKGFKEKFEQARNSSLLKVYTYDEINELSLWEDFHRIPYKKDKVCVTVHTSGTTGIAKPINLTHDNINAYAHQAKDMDMNFGAGDTAMHILPFFAAYGIMNVLHVGLCSGVCMQEIPEINAEGLIKILDLYKPSVVVGIPSWYIGMKKSNADIDLSFIKWISYGGMKMDEKDEEEFNLFLASKGCPVKVSKGFGLSETGGNCSLETGENNKIGYSGIPTPLTTFGVVDPQTKEPIRFTDKDYVEGELIVASPTVSNVQFDDQQYIKGQQMFGDYYIYAGDVVQLNKEGDLKYKDRGDRVFQRFDGFNVVPWLVEEELKKHPLIKDCFISPYFEEAVTGNMVKANIILEEEIPDDLKINLVKELIEEIFMKSEKLVIRQLPTKFAFKKSFPQTLSGKIDYKKIYAESLDGNEITVLLDASNININDIKVIGPKKGKTLSLYK